MKKLHYSFAVFWQPLYPLKKPVQFCVSFEDEEHYRLLLVDESPTDFTPAKKLELYPTP
jgi:hypothetical protein